MMDSQPPQPGLSGSKSSRLAGSSSNTSLIGTQQECRHQLVNRDAAYEVSRNMTQYAQLKMVRKTGSSMNKKQHAVGCENIHTRVNGNQLTVNRTVVVLRELGDQFMAGSDGKHPLSTRVFVCTVREIEHHNVASSGIVADEFPEKHPQERTKQALITLEEATEAYIVDVIAASHCLKQQQISCRCSTCLRRWQGREVVYSWNRPMCAWAWKWPKKGFRVPQ